MTSSGALVLVLGDQLSPANPVFTAADRDCDRIVLAEVGEEAGYVAHNRHKIALIFAAMRHFARRLRDEGWAVDYYRYEDGCGSLLEAVQRSLAAGSYRAITICEPGEHRLALAFQQWSALLQRPVSILPDTRFLASHTDFRGWARDRKQLRMEYFYRDMRKRYHLLLDPAGQPEGGQWNYDTENRKGWRAQAPLPPRTAAALDPITREVLALVTREFPENPGDLSQFRWAVTAAGAQLEFDHFVEAALPHFGTYQDALAEESPWVYHSLIAAYLNIGLLEPLAVCRQVEQAWRDGHCSLAAAEGFIRQIVGWREYVRGMYWLLMPDYAGRNALQARRPLPDFFWTAATDLRCLQRALAQSLDLGYAHHIQRLMVIGNFALLAGLDVQAVCAWYLAVYVDAFEWVELPNTLGMALHADGGVLASKPYAASGSYIARQGNHCGQCRYDPKQATGPRACPYNSLYWHFIDRHAERFRANPRMGLILANWAKRAPAERTAILNWGEQMLQQLAPETGSTTI